MKKLTQGQKKLLATFPKFDEEQIARLRQNPEYLRAYVSVCLEDYAKDKNLDLLKYSLGVVVRALGATNVSRKVNVSRTGLYKSFTTRGNPSFATVCGILDMAGVGLSAHPL